MTTRNQFILELRGNSSLGEVTDQSSIEEKFQNQTLRPILKLQNELLILVFKNYIAKYKNDFVNYSIDKKLKFIENAIQKDNKFRNLLKGIVVGLFSSDEYEQYSINTSSLNKRMMNMLIERLQSQIQLFDK